LCDTRNVEHNKQNQKSCRVGLQSTRDRNHIAFSRTRSSRVSFCSDNPSSLGSCNSNSCSADFRGRTNPQGFSCSMGDHQSTNRPTVGGRRHLRLTRLMKEMKQEMNLISKSVKPRRVITLSVFLFCLASLALMIHTPASLGDQLTTYTNPTIPVWSISFPSSWMANNQTSGSFGITYQQLGLSVIWNQGQDAHQIRSSFEATLGNLGAIQVQSDNSGTQFGTQVETVVYTLTSNQGSQEEVVAR
jgi:hypothetical protein